MGIISSSAFSTKQVIQNEFLAQSNQQCISRAQGTVSNTTIILNNSEVGNITVESVGDADLNCIINQQFNASITSQLASQSEQLTSNSTDMFNDFVLLNTSINTAFVNQQIYNNITSITNSTCAATSEQLVNNTLIQANYTTAGDVGISADSSTSATCTLNNVIAMEAFNQTAADNDQDVDNEGMFVAILTSLAGLIIIIAIVIVIIIIVAIVAKKSKSKAANEEPTDPEDAELAALEAELTTQ